jgi:hypothetical protein
MIQFLIVVQFDISKEEERYTIDQIKKYLDSDYLDEARDVLVEG